MPQVKRGNALRGTKYHLIYTHLAQSENREEGGVLARLRHHLEKQIKRKIVKQGWRLKIETKSSSKPPIAWERFPALWFQGAPGRVRQKGY